MPVCKSHPPAQQPSMAPYCLHGKDQTSRLAVRALYTGVWPPLLFCRNLCSDLVTHSVCLSKRLAAAFLPPTPPWNQGTSPLSSLPRSSVLLPFFGPPVHVPLLRNSHHTLWASPRDSSNVHQASDLKKTLKLRPRIFSFFNVPLSGLVRSFFN